MGGENLNNLKKTLVYLSILYIKAFFIINLVNQNVIQSIKIRMKYQLYN